MMNPVFKVRGPDERYHVFRPTSDGGWQHFSRIPGDSFSVLEDAGRVLNLQEVRDYVESLKGFGPITEDEVKWIKLHAREGKPYQGVDWGKEVEEPNADPMRTRPPARFQCMGCTMWFDGADRRRFTWETFPDDKGYCIPCHNKRIRGMGFHSG